MSPGERRACSAVGRRPLLPRVGRTVRSSLIVVGLLLAAFTAGQLMLASHTAASTRHLVAAAAAAVVLLVGLGVIARSRPTATPAPGMNPLPQEQPMPTRSRSRRRGTSTQPVEPMTWSEWWSGAGATCPSRTCPLSDHHQKGQIMSESTPTKVRLSGLRVFLLLFLPLAAGFFFHFRYGEIAGWGALVGGAVVAGFIARLGATKASRT